jgi:hypothetical protein
VSLSPSGSCWLENVLFRVVQGAALVLAIWGIVRLSQGLGYQVGITILLLVLSFIPVVNLVMLLVLNARVTGVLKAYGYKVGLMGARTQKE